MRSGVFKKGIDTLPHRSLFSAAGVAPGDLCKPFIGVANSYNDVIPGHVHLNGLADEVKRGIRDAGGVPFAWGVPGVCDGIAMHTEMRLSLPSREHIAENIEIMMLSHSFDGWVGITNCDKITPGMLMAAMRLNLPAVLLTGGPMMAGTHGGRRLDLVSCFEAVGQVRAGRMTEAEAEELSARACPGAGSCAGLFTANTMAILTETMGMSLTGSASPPAISQERRRIAYETGRRAVALVTQNVLPRGIMSDRAFTNAWMVDLAVGGSTNTALHLPAIAREAGIALDLRELDGLSRRVPNICHLRPSGDHFMEDFDRAGGVPAVLDRLAGMLADTPTVSGPSTLAIARGAACADDEVIRPLARPFATEGGMAVLRGNLADESVVKQAAVQAEMMRHSGPALVFHSEQAVLDAIRDGRIREGNVLVLPFQGPAGAPGMPEMLTPTSAVMGAGFDRVALVTDGRFSGGTRGPCIGHVSREAYLGGAIGAVRDGDVIDIDIPGRSLNVRLPDAEIARRLRVVRPPERPMSPLLARYRRQVVDGFAARKDVPWLA
ncbi:MAG: dihydroxy-acid dehydratase [Acidobacteria bacterium]|nr:dihydroxy-acid dehydratase [Acidobacteriota bacterium]